MAAAKYPKISGNASTHAGTGAFYDLVLEDSVQYDNSNAPNESSAFPNIIVTKFTSTTTGYQEAYAVVVIKNDSLDVNNDLTISDVGLFDDISGTTAITPADSPVTLTARKKHTDGELLDEPFIGIQKQTSPWGIEINYTQTIDTNVVTADGGSRAVVINVDSSGKIVLADLGVDAATGGATGAIIDDNMGVTGTAVTGNKRIIPIYTPEFIEANPIPGGSYAAFLVRCTPIGLSAAEVFESYKYLRVTHNGNAAPFNITIQSTPNNVIILTTDANGSNVPQGTTVVSSTLKHPVSVPTLGSGANGMFTGLDYCRYVLLPVELGGLDAGTAGLTEAGLDLPADARSNKTIWSEDDVADFFQLVVDAGFDGAYSTVDKDTYVGDSAYREWWRANTRRNVLFSGVTMTSQDTSTFGENVRVIATEGTPSNSMLQENGITPIAGTSPGSLALLDFADGNPQGLNIHDWKSDDVYTYSFNQTKDSTLYNSVTAVNIGQLASSGLYNDFALADVTKYSSVQIQMSDAVNTADTQTAAAIYPFAIYPTYTIPTGLTSSIVSPALSMLYLLNMKTLIPWASAANDTKYVIPHNNPASTFYAKAGNKTPVPFFYQAISPYNSEAKTQFNFNVTNNSLQTESDVVTYGLIKQGENPSVEDGTSGLGLNDQYFDASKMKIVTGGNITKGESLATFNNATSSGLAAYDSKANMFATDGSTTVTHMINFASSEQFAEHVIPQTNFYSVYINSGTQTEYPDTTTGNIPAYDPFDPSNIDPFDVTGVYVKNVSVTIPTALIDYGNGMVPDYLWGTQEATVKVGYYRQPPTLSLSGQPAATDENGGAFSQITINPGAATKPRLDYINYSGTFYNWDHGTYGIAVAGNFNGATPSGPNDGLYDWKLDGTFAAESTRCAKFVAGHLDKLEFDITHTPQSGGYDNTDHHNDFKAGSFPSASNEITIHSDDQADTYTADADGVNRCKISVGQRVYQITSGTPTKLLNTKEYYVKSLTYSGTAGASSVVTVILNQDSETGAATNADFRFVDTWVSKGMEVIAPTLLTDNTKRYFLDVKHTGASSDTDVSRYTIKDQDGNAVNGVEGNAIVTIKKPGVTPYEAKYGWDTYWSIPKTDPSNIIAGDYVEIVTNTGSAGTLTTGADSDLSAMSGSTDTPNTVGTKFTATGTGPANKGTFKLHVNSPIVPGLTDSAGNNQLAYRSAQSLLETNTDADASDLHMQSCTLNNNDIYGANYKKAFSIPLQNFGEEDVYLVSMEWYDANYIPQGKFYRDPYTSVGAAPAAATVATWSLSNTEIDVNETVTAARWYNQSDWNAVTNRWDNLDVAPRDLPNNSDLGDRRLTRVALNPLFVYGLFSVDKTDASGDYYKVLKIKYYRNASQTEKYKTLSDGAPTYRPFKDKELWEANLLFHIKIDNATEISLSDADGSNIAADTQIIFADIEQ